MARSALPRRLASQSGAGRRATHTHIDMPDAEAVYTVTFVELAAERTLLSILVQHTSRDKRDEYLRYSDGLHEAMAMFEQVVLELRQ